MGELHEACLTSCSLVLPQDSSGSLDNVFAVQNTVMDTGLDPESCDTILLVDVYHEFSEPVAMLQSMRQARGGGQGHVGGSPTTALPPGAMRAGPAGSSGSES